MSYFNIISIESVESLSNIVLYLSTPALVLNSFQIQFSFEFLNQIKSFIILAIVTNLLAIVVAIFFSKNDKQLQYLIAFGNTGFIGIPIISSIFGKNEIVLMSLYLAIGNVFIWTFGITRFTKKLDSKQIRKTLLNPSNVALIIGFLYVFKLLPLPLITFEIMEILSGMNLPIIMIVLGCYFSEITVHTFIKDKRVLAASFYRLILIPTIMIVFLTVIKIVDFNSYLVLVIAHATPGATLAAVFAKKAKIDAGFVIGFILISTLLSIITLPLMMGLARYLY